MPGVVKLRTNAAPAQLGELARLRVVQGPDAGFVFVLSSPRAKVGRGMESDVVLTDLKASRVHAELFSDAGGWSVRDLGSSNGILLNARAVRNSRLKGGDTIALGETLFEFQISGAPVALNASPVMKPQPKNAGGFMPSAVSGMPAPGMPAAGMGYLPGMPGGLAGGVQGVSRVPEGGGRKLILGLLVAGLAVSFLFEEEPAQKEAKKQSGASRDTASFNFDVPSALDPNSEMGQMAEMFFKIGLREFREGNYLRAREQFAAVEQIDENYRSVGEYIKAANTEIVRAVQDHLVRGIQSFNAGKLQDAKGQFEAVLRLLHADPENPAYIEASEQLRKVEDVLKRT